MKILKYIIFLSILTGVFFIIYRESDHKGLCRWRISLKLAVLIAASVAGLITAKAIEPDVPDNVPSIERVFSNQELDLFDDSNSRVILAKTGDSAPSVPTSPGRGQPSPFPTPPSGGRPSRPVYVPKYRTAPKVVDQGLGAGGNPAGAGGGGGAAEFDDQCPAPKKKEQSQKSDRNEFQSDIYNSKKKTNRKAEQSDVTDGKIEIVSKIKEDAGLVRAAEEACKNADVQKDINHLEEELAKGNNNPGIGRKPIGNGIIEHRGKNGGRLYVRESDSVIEILAKSGKKKSNQQFVINRLNKIYG